MKGSVGNGGADGIKRGKSARAGMKRAERWVNAGEDENARLVRRGKSEEVRRKVGRTNGRVEDEENA